MADVFKSNAESLGVEFDDSVNKFTGSSTDMGNVSHTVLSIQPLFAIETTAVNHTKEFAVAAGIAKNNA